MMSNPFEETPIVDLKPKPAITINKTQIIIIAVGILIALSVLIIIFSPFGKGTLTKKTSGDFRNVNLGMTLDEVKAILAEDEYKATIMPPINGITLITMDGVEEYGLRFKVSYVISDNKLTSILCSTDPIPNTAKRNSDFQTAYKSLEKIYGSPPDKETSDTSHIWSTPTCQIVLISVEKSKDISILFAPNDNGASLTENKSKVSGNPIEPAHKYENSTYKIGTDMPSGEYVLFTTSHGYFCVSSDSTGNSILFNGNFTTNSIITVKDGEYLELSRCYAEPMSDVNSLPASGEGMFLVGKHIGAGEYKLEASGHGYYCVYSDSRHNNIITNGNFEGNAYVTVKDGQYLLLSHSKIVE